jgi:hypothetical protein
MKTDSEDGRFLDPIYFGMSAESQNFEAIRDSRCWGTVLQTRPLLGDGAINTSPRQQWRHATTEELFSTMFSVPSVYSIVSSPSGVKLLNLLGDEFQLSAPQ